MTYWHMQLHPNDLEWRREEELIGNIGDSAYIGVGDGLTEIDFEVIRFKKSISIGDIILIRRQKTIIALVEVVVDFEDRIDNDLSNLDWFRYRREVKVLDINKENCEIEYFDSDKFLSKAQKGKKPYQYILDWHKRISPSFYRNQKGLKLEKIYIQKYKIFQELNLNFNEQITIVAGINGSGKTTLLEYIKNFKNFISDKDDDKSFINFSMYSEKSKKSKSETLSYRNANSLEAKYFSEKIIYFPTGTDISDLKAFLVSYVTKTMHKENLRPSDVFDRIREKIDKIFQDLDILVKFDNVDEKGNVFFRNKKDEVFSIDGISTGEKTLLSKVLYLYLREIKDSVILIDEPELSLHPAWQNRVLKLYENFAKENNCQIIIATHSPHIIGSAKNEWIRILTEDGVINDVLAYGRDIEWVLEEVMGASYTREPTIAKKIKECQELLNEDKYDEAEEFIDALEVLIGANDSEVMSLRNSLEFWRE